MGNNLQQYQGCTPVCYGAVYQQVYEVASDSMLSLNFQYWRCAVIGGKLCNVF